MKEKKTNEVQTNVDKLEKCCISGCENKSTIRNFRSLNAQVGHWKIKNELQSIYDEDAENSLLKICVEHYNADLKQFPRAKRKKKYKRKKVESKMQQNEVEKKPLKLKKMKKKLNKYEKESFYSLIYNFQNEPW